MVTQKQKQVKEQEFTEADLRAEEIEYERTRQNWRLYYQFQQQEESNKEGEK